MRKLAFTGIILQPSVASFIGVVIGTALIFATTIVNIGGSSDHFFRLLLGQDSSFELVDSTKSIVSNIGDLIFGNVIVNNILFFGFWLLVGVIVYIVLSGAGEGLLTIQQIHDEENMLHVHKERLEQQTMVRLTLRAAFLLAWLLYAVIFWKFLLPFSVLAFQAATGDFVQISTALIGILGFVTLLVSLHLHIVLLRGVLLRPRIIGGWDDILAARLT